jgi:CcmD family protein
MRTLMRVVAAVFVLAGLGFSGSVPDSAAILLAQEQPKQQEEFTPIDQLPPQDQLPAAPLLVGAYAFVLLMLFGYLFMVSRRLSLIQSEVERLDSDLKRSGRG